MEKEVQEKTEEEIKRELFAKIDAAIDLAETKEGKKRPPMGIKHKDDKNYWWKKYLT